MIVRQFDIKIKTITSDNGQEFLSSKLSNFLIDRCAYNPQQNGLVSDSIDTYLNWQ